MSDEELITPFSPAKAPDEQTEPVESKLSDESIHQPSQHLSDLVELEEEKTEEEADLPPIEDLEEEAALDEDEEEDDEDLDEELGDPDEDATRRQNQDRAKRRLSNKRAEELEAENEELRKNQITEKDLEDYRAIKTEAAKVKRLELGEAFEEAFRQEEAARAEAGQPAPKHSKAAKEAWIDQEIRAREPPVTADTIRRTIREEFGHLRKQAIDEETSGTAAKSQAEERTTFIKDLNGLAKEDAEIVPLRRIILKSWEADGRTRSAKDYVREATGTQRKAGKTRKGERARRRRGTVPLSTGKGARRSSKKTNQLDMIDKEGMDVSQLAAAARSGRIDLSG